MLLPYDENELRLRDAALRHLARRVSWTEADAEDAVQEAWLTSLVAPPRDARRLSAWLRIVAVHAAGKIQRRHRNQRERLRLGARSGEVRSVLDELEQESASARVLEWIQLLEEPYREVVRLRYVEELAAAEIAARLGRREGTVRVQLKRGLDMLRVRAGLSAPGRSDRAVRNGRGLLVWWLARARKAWMPALACGVAALLGLLWFAPALLLRSTAPSVSHARTEAQDSVLAALVLAEAEAAPEARVSVIPPIPPATPPSAATGAEAGSFVEGTCTTDQREPVPGAEIWGAPDGRLAAGELLGHADGEGRYRVHVPYGVHWLWADEVQRADDGTEEQRSGSLRIRVPGEPGRAPVELFFPARLSVELSGTVVDPGGVPVAGARVRAGDAWRGNGLVHERWLIHPHPSSATTDEHGEFRLRLYRQAHADLCVETPGFPPVSASVAASTKRVTIRLSRPAVVAGRLVDSDGGALSAAVVHLELDAPMPVLRARTDETGRFRFGSVPPGAFTLRGFPAAAGPSLVHAARCAEGEAVDLGDLAATTSHSLRGIASAQGAPVAGWRVVLREESPASASAEPLVALTGEDGAFEFQACRDTGHRAWLLEPGADGPARASVGDVRPGGGALRLEAAPADARVLGRVEDSLRSEGHVLLDGALLSRPVLVRVAADGTFECRVPAGKYELHGLTRALGRWSLARLELAAGETRFLEARRPPAGSLLVRLEPAPGLERSSLSSLQGQLIGSGYSSSFYADGIGAEIDVEEGTLRFPTLQAGDYALLLCTGDTGAEYRSARIEPGRETALDVQFEPGHKVKVHCRSERELLPGEQFACVIASKHGEVRFTASELLPGTLEAMFLFRKLLPAGAYTLDVESDRGLTGSLEFSVPSSERHVLALR